MLQEFFPFSDYIADIYNLAVLNKAWCTFMYVPQF